MTVYADILVIVNLYIDFFLLWCAQSFLGLRTRVRRLVLGALLGGVLSLTALLPIEAPALSLLLTLGTAFAVTAAAFAPLRLPLFLRAAVCFFACTLGLAGFFLLLLRFFAPKNVAVLGSVLYFDLSPALLFCFTIGAYFVFWGARKLFPRDTGALRCRSILIEHRGVKIKVCAKADSGCALREPFSGLPVLLCEAKKLSGISPAPEERRVIPFESVGGGGMLSGFRAEHVFLEPEHTPLACYIALCERPLSAGQFDALYNPDQFPNLS